MKLILLYWHTVRHLRLIQITGRVWRRLYRPKLPPCEEPPLIRNPEGKWVKGAKHSPSLIGPREFTFLNKSGILDDIGWTGDGRSKLWRYNQHYFDDLNASRSGERHDWHSNLLADWLVKNSSCQGEGWEPYPCSIRIVNLIKWVLSGNCLPVEHLISLTLQARWLKKNMEVHIMGNHIIANAKALIFAGVFFRGEEADNWLKEGERILFREIHEQILNDGAHFELSPMYQRIILEDFLDLINLTIAYPKRLPDRLEVRVKAQISKMFHWMCAMSHPDKSVSFFNDSAIGISSSLESLCAYAKRLHLIEKESIKSHTQIFLENSGYFRWEREGATIIGDVGHIGPDYLPGHGHADTLSFEFTLNLQRVIVNSGTSLYEESAERIRQRGTSAHNTVEIDGENSSEVWKSFRVARRAKPFDLNIKKQCENWTQISCSHDGYKRLRERKIHNRSWQLEKGRLVIRDKIEGTFFSAIARFYLHPEIEIFDEHLRLPSGEKIQYAAHGGDIKLVDSTWHPEFGLSIPSKCIELYFDSHEVSMEFTWG